MLQIGLAMDTSPAKHKETRWWNDDVGNRASEKYRLWIVDTVKTGKRNAEKYLETKQKTRKTVYQVKWTIKGERKRFVQFMWRNYQKSDVLKIAKRMFKTNQNIIKNGDGVLGISDEGTKSYYDKLLNTNFVWDRNSLS